jgi:general secretion pathway protein F
VPLELGLLGFSRDQPAQLGRINSAIAERMSRGDSLPDAIAAEGDRFPPVYRVVVDAGLKSGRLTAALEAMSRFASELADLRRHVGLALVYPLIVLSLAYGLFVVFLLAIVGRFHDSAVVFDIPMGRALKFLFDLQGTAVYWAWLPPVCLLLFVWWWQARGRVDSLSGAGPQGPLGWIPGVKRIRSNSLHANFAELLALLIEHDVPLPQALELAADATGDAGIQNSAHQAADALRRGDDVGRALIGRGGFPPFLRWIVSQSPGQRSLAHSLHTAADLYRQRAVDATDWLKLGFPIAAGIVIGGGSALLYSLTVFLPLVDLLENLAAP